MASSDLGAHNGQQSNPFSFGASLKSKPLKEGLGWKWQLLIFFLAAAAVVSRRPDALLNPQFFGEDGSVWYANAYTFGWFTSLLHSQNGYFQTLPRLAASLALLVPLRYGPLIMNLVGITFQVLPVNILLSWRCSRWAPLSVRAFMAVVYIGLPNSLELNVSVEEGQWHVALAAAMLVLARMPWKSWAWHVFDVFIVLICGLTGPFCIVLFPIALFYWWIRRERFRLVTAGLLALTAVIQLTAIAQTAAETRPKVGLGATMRLFIEIVSGRVYLGALLGGNSLPAHANLFALSLLGLIATAILVYCIITASMELRLFLIFALLVFSISLRSPMVSLTVPQWQVMRAAVGVRYWFFPMLAFAWAMIWCAREGNTGFFRLASVCGLTCMVIGMSRDWSYPPYTDFHFGDYARAFDAAVPGTTFNIPTYPPGFVLRLTKKSALCKSFPVGFVDTPSPHAQLSGSVNVTGWVFGAAPVEDLSLSIDHVLKTTTKPSQVRPDVDAHFPQATTREKGWTAVLNLAGIAPGKHELEAKAHVANGCVAEFYSMPIEIVK